MVPLFQNQHQNDRAKTRTCARNGAAAGLGTKRKRGGPCGLDKTTASTKTEPDAFNASACMRIRVNIYSSNTAVEGVHLTSTQTRAHTPVTLRYKAGK